MQYAVCCVPVSPLRKEPSHTTEMNSQQLFGEVCSVVEKVHNWVKITCKYDGYQGWCQASHLVEINEEQFSSGEEKLTWDYVNKVMCNGQKMFVPSGSSLITFKKQKALWQKNVCIYKGETWLPSANKITKKSIRMISRKFLNSPYLWGGKSVFGIDCSGFSQLVYKFLNIYLPRDSHQQAELGKTINSLRQAHCGDLCFFDNEEGRIIHVGILLNHHQVIHSSGKVRIDQIDDKGIINGDTKLYTHSLKIIKRYFEFFC